MLVRIDIKLKIIRTVLLLMAVFLFSLGLDHIFFPQQGHELINQPYFEAGHPWMVMASKGLGVYFLIMGLAALLAISNPVKDKWLVLIVVLSSALNDLIRASAVGYSGILPVILISMVLWLLIVIFFPYEIPEK